MKDIEMIYAEIACLKEQRHPFGFMEGLYQTPCSSAFPSVCSKEKSAFRNYYIPT